MVSSSGTFSAAARTRLLTLVDRRARCLLVYLAPGTSAQFSVSGSLANLRRRGAVEYVCLANGCELRLDWLVAVHELAEAA